MYKHKISHIAMWYPGLPRCVFSIVRPERSTFESWDQHESFWDSSHPAREAQKSCAGHWPFSQPHFPHLEVQTEHATPACTNCQWYEPEHRAKEVPPDVYWCRPAASCAFAWGTRLVSHVHSATTSPQSAHWYASCSQSWCIFCTHAFLCTQRLGPRTTCSENSESSAAWTPPLVKGTLLVVALLESLLKEDPCDAEGCLLCDLYVACQVQSNLRKLSFFVYPMWQHLV